MLRKISNRLVSQKKFNLDKIRNQTETPKLQLFSGGNWVDSKGSYEKIPHPLDSRISIAEVPILDLAEERNMIKQSMQQVKNLYLVILVPQIWTS